MVAPWFASRFLRNALRYFSCAASMLKAVATLFCIRARASAPQRVVEIAILLQSPGNSFCQIFAFSTGRSMTMIVRLVFRVIIISAWPIFTLLDEPHSFRNSSTQHLCSEESTLRLLNDLLIDTLWRVVHDYSPGLVVNLCIDFGVSN